jgi:hypothetical protein
VRTWDVWTAGFGRYVGTVRASTWVEAMGRAIVLAASRPFRPARLVLVEWM